MTIHWKAVEQVRYCGAVCGNFGTFINVGLALPVVKLFWITEGTLVNGYNGQILKPFIQCCSKVNTEYSPIKGSLLKSEESSNSADRWSASNRSHGLKKDNVS